MRGFFAKYFYNVTRFYTLLIAVFTVFTGAMHKLTCWPAANKQCRRAPEEKETGMYKEVYRQLIITCCLRDG
jgi:hypothetical protein